MIQTLVATLMWALVASLLIFRRKRADRSVTYAAITIAIAMTLNVDAIYTAVDPLLGGTNIATLIADALLMTGLFFLGRGAEKVVLPDHAASVEGLQHLQRGRGTIEGAQRLAQLAVFHEAGRERLATVGGCGRGLLDVVQCPLLHDSIQQGGAALRIFVCGRSSLALIRCQRTVRLA